jgi:hypothetical protein
VLIVYLGGGVTDGHGVLVVAGRVELAKEDAGSVRKPEELLAIAAAPLVDVDEPLERPEFAAGKFELPAAPEEVEVLADERTTLFDGAPAAEEMLTDNGTDVEEEPEREETATGEADEEAEDEADEGLIGEAIALLDTAAEDKPAEIEEGAAIDAEETAALEAAAMLEPAAEDAGELGAADDEAPGTTAKTARARAPPQISFASPPQGTEQDASPGYVGELVKLSLQ